MIWAKETKYILTARQYLDSSQASLKLLGFGMAGAFFILLMVVCFYFGFVLSKFVSNLLQPTGAQYADTVEIPKGLLRHTHEVLGAKANVRLPQDALDNKRRRKQRERPRDIQFLRKRLAQEPDSARIHAELGHALVAAGDRSGAFVEFQKAVEIDYSLSDAHYELAMAYHVQREFDLARKHAMAGKTLGHEKCTFEFIEVVAGER